MAARMGNLTALADSEAVAPVSPEEALTMLNRLEEGPSSSQMMAALGHFKEALKGMDEISRELAREGAVKRLRVLGFASPGRIVDAAMPPSVRPSSDTRGGGAIGFQDPDLWPEAVAGSALLGKLEETVGRYLALGPDQMVPFVLWILLAHAHEAFEISPILAITSPDKGCGKSTALALLSALVPRPLTSANITASAVFRVTDYFRPTLLLDEADTFITDSEGLRGILNSGHMRSQAYVTRVAGDEHRVSMFSTWTPKAIALIGELPATLADRSVMIRMRRRSRAESIERLQLHRLGRWRICAPWRHAGRWTTWTSCASPTRNSPPPSPRTGHGITGALFYPSRIWRERNGPGGRGRAPAASMPSRPTTPPSASCSSKTCVRSFNPVAWRSWFPRTSWNTCAGWRSVPGPSGETEAR